MKRLKSGFFAESRGCFIVAEISSNHQQDFRTAVKLIRLAKAAGADAVKFQTFLPESMTIDADNKYFRILHPEWGGQTLYQLYKKAYAPWGWFKELKRIADGLGIVFFSTAFDKSAVDFLEELNVPLHKISSFELVDLALIEYAAKTRKPLILSTGMATVNEIEEAVDAAKSAGAKEIILLKCASSYPARPQAMNLRTIPDLKKRFGLQVGLSDHSLGTATALAAVALGARLIEKHFIHSRKAAALDNFFSLTPPEFRNLADNIRIAEKSLGRVRYGITEGEKSSLIFRRSLFAVKDIKKGELFAGDNIRSIRPSAGLKPKYVSEILGKKAERDIKKGTPLRWELVSNCRKWKPLSL